MFLLQLLGSLSIETAPLHAALASGDYVYQVFVAWAFCFFASWFYSLVTCMVCVEQQNLSPIPPTSLLIAGLVSSDAICAYGISFFLLDT